MTTFTGITVWRASFSFRLSFRHNLADRSGTETLLLRLVAADGREGYGQILPRPYLTGETLESALEDVSERWWPIVRELEFGRHPVAETLLPMYMAADSDRRTAGYAGIDVAVRSAMGLYNSAAGFANRLDENRRVGLVGVIPATGARKAALLTRVLKAIGYRRFKVKVGKDAARDARRLSAVRRILGTGSWLAADANAAWDLEEAERRMRGLRKDFGVELVEEPLRRDVAVTTDFRLLERRAGVETMADETLCTTDDGKMLLDRGSPSWWNLRLAKNGGFLGVSALAGMARRAGIRLYGGILVGETGILAAASRAAFFEIGVECGEYGFSRVFLKGDPFRGSPAGYRGFFTPPVMGETGVGVGKNGMPGEVVFSDKS